MKKQKNKFLKNLKFKFKIKKFKKTSPVNRNQRILLFFRNYNSNFKFKLQITIQT